MLARTQTSVTIFAKYKTAHVASQQNQQTGNSMRSLLFSILFMSSCQSWAAQDEWFVEFPDIGHGGRTLLYDLRTVQTIQPGRFTIVSTWIDDADMMAFELKALDTLRTYCKSPDGKYPPPTNVFTMGSPDLSVNDIEVQTKNPGRKDEYKIASWDYPYKRIAIEERDGTFFQMKLYLECKRQFRDPLESYLEKRAEITNGERARQLFDCKRGLHAFTGVPFIDGREPSAALMQK
jgi:hypothetical protein